MFWLIYANTIFINEIVNTFMFLLYALHILLISIILLVPEQ